MVSSLRSRDAAHPARIVLWDRLWLHRQQPDLRAKVMTHQPGGRLRIVPADRGEDCPMLRDVALRILGHPSYHLVAEISQATDDALETEEEHAVLRSARDAHVESLVLSKVRLALGDL